MESVRILKIIGENSAHVRWHMFAVCRAVSWGFLAWTLPTFPCPLDDKHEKKLVDQFAYHIDIIVRLGWSGWLKVLLVSFLRKKNTAGWLADLTGEQAAYRSTDVWALATPEPTISLPCWLVC
jgi:hypothetical protein